mmetsp:Transcript_23739/g.64588  ORF Transcript_23739/g.64588 Transcript_23739/m.64588 type:complete len:261 (-) Transcript_23739:481-1263(-)
MASPHSNPRFSSTSEMTSAMKVMSLLRVACCILCSKASTLFRAWFLLSLPAVCAPSPAVSAPALPGGASVRCFSLTISLLPDSSCTATCPSSILDRSAGRTWTTCPLYSALCMVRRNMRWPTRNFPVVVLALLGATSFGFPMISSGGMESSEPGSSLPSFFRRIRGGMSSMSLSSVIFSILSWRTAKTRPDLANFTATLSFLMVSTSKITSALCPLYSARERPFSITLSPTTKERLPRAADLRVGTESSESTSSVHEAAG